MIRLRTGTCFGALVILALGGACSGSSAADELLDVAVTIDAPRSTTAGLASELEHLARLTSIWAWAYVVIVATLAWAAVHVVDRLSVLAMRRGWQFPRRRPYLALVLQCLFLGTGVLVAVRPFFARAPLVTTLLCTATAAVSAAVFRETVQSMVAGLAMTTRGRLHLGDHVDVDGVSGVVRQFGLTHTRLRAADASTLWVPNRVLDRSTIVVGGVKNASRVQADLGDRFGNLDDRARARVQQLAQISPYRRARSPVAITREGGRASVELQTWATRDVDRVTTQLRAALEHGYTATDDVVPTALDKPTQGARA